MSKEHFLPNKVDAFRFAENGISLQGTLLIQDMQRLSACLIDTKGEVGINVQFGMDEQRLPFLRGQLVAQVTLQCQRCLEPYVFDASGNFFLGIVQAEEDIEQHPKGYDSVVAKEGMLIIKDIIEDELIINLPIVPKHKMNDCKKSPLAIDSTPTPETDKENPFKVIEFLRAKRNSNK